MFATAQQTATSHLIGVNRAEKALAVSVVPENVVAYVMGKLSDVELAMRLALRNGSSGAETFLWSPSTSSLKIKNIEKQHQMLLTPPTALTTLQSTSIVSQTLCGPLLESRNMFKLCFELTVPLKRVLYLS